MPDIPPILDDYINGLKAHDVDRIANTVADDLCFVTPAKNVDRTGFLNFLRSLYTAFPDWHYDHDDPVIMDDEIAVKWRQGGTHTGTFTLPGREPIAATGKQVKIPEQFFFYKVSNNRIVRIRPEPIPNGAPQGILQQIGGTFLPSR